MSYFNDTKLDEIILSFCNTGYLFENEVITHIKSELNSIFDTNKVSIIARELINYERCYKDRSFVEKLVSYYNIDSPRGYSLMCLSESLLRIPDSRTQNDLIYDKLKDIRETDEQQADTFMLSSVDKALQIAANLIAKGEEPVNNPVVRTAINKMMGVLGNHFVLGQDIKQAVKNSNKNQDFLYSFDMLGEAARSEDQALRYLEEYKNAAIVTGELQQDISDDIFKNDGISVKLSALYSSYELNKYKDVQDILVPRLSEIIELAMKYNISVIIDAEEARRLDLSLLVLRDILFDSKFKGYNGIGIAIQAYNKKSLKLIDTIASIAKETGRIIPVRLVKGAYWDYEIKYAQSNGHKDYPVFTQKNYTDLSYMLAANKLIEYSQYIYPQFATHNDYTVAFILSLLEKRQSINFEFQKLYGMGDALYKKIVAEYGYKCRVYAPVGEHSELLPYLIRRLVENGANSSFVNKLLDNSVSIDELCLSPFEDNIENKYIELPEDIYGNSRKNSMAFDLGSISVLSDLENSLKKYSLSEYKSYTLSSVEIKENIESKIIYSPHNHNNKVGLCYETPISYCDQILSEAYNSYKKWSETNVEYRANILVKASDILSSRINEAIYLLIEEAGKNIFNAVNEVREAIDFLRYYADQAKNIMQEEKIKYGITGEDNILSYKGKGVFVCISPWNFPLAIFIGQVSAALVTGNTVIAKPAEQTSLIASFMINILYEAGIDKSVLHMCLGKGEEIGQQLISNDMVTGVCFTGSTEVAHHINKNLALRDTTPATLIAETGGQNCMIVDNSALIEQVADDIILSAFDSAGQRCSALRVLYIEEGIYDKLLDLVIGFTNKLEISETSNFSADIGAVIDKDAQSNLQNHINNMKEKGYNPLYSGIIKDKISKQGNFFAPHIYEIENINILEKEIFGPVLHVIKYKYKDIDNIISDINNTNYALTFGVHSRINKRIDYIISKIDAGNIYVNQATIGAVVGSQPFGGYRKSGTGPKAGGKNYLHRFVNEKLVSINTTSIGGNIELLS